MKSCRQTRLQNIVRWLRVIQGLQDAYSKKRAIGLILREARGSARLTLKEASEKTGLSEMELHKLFEREDKQEARFRWIYHTGNRMFYYDGG